MLISIWPEDFFIKVDSVHSWKFSPLSTGT